MPFQQYPSKGGIPSGATAARPSGAVQGDTYYNGQLGLLEIYDGTNWVPCSAPAGIPTVVGTDVGTGRAYSSGAITIAFTAGTNGGAPYGYTGTATSGSLTYTTGATTTSSITLSVGNPGTYSLAGTAYNGFGTSPVSTPTNVTVTTVPNVPTGVTVANVSAYTSDVTVSWTAPADNGGKSITGYTVVPYLGATAQTTTTTTGTSATISGLTQGSVYTFKVKATNANGTGLESTASSSWTIPTVITVSYTVVAGGGGGSDIIGGGGGGGGVLDSSLSIATGTAVTVTVGAGGRGADWYNSGVNQEAGYPGFNSVFATQTATGGGGTWGWNQTALPTYSGQRTWTKNGGCGGGGSGTQSPTDYDPNAQTGGTGISGQGYAGGNGADPYGAGGGGAGGAGIQVTSTTNQVSGGVGKQSSINSSYYGGGGGGGRRTSGAGNGPSLANSNGGGGHGMSGGTFNSNQNGGGNTGGGGGGGNYTGPTSTQCGGTGGSGVVIIKIPSANSATFSGGVSQSSSTSSGYKIYTITAAGTSDTVTFSQE